MKIDIKLDLQKIAENEVRCIDKVDTYETLYISENLLRNLRYIYGAGTDDFKNLAKLFFLIQKNNEEMEDEDITKELQNIERSLLRFAVQQQFDF